MEGLKTFEKDHISSVRNFISGNELRLTVSELKNELNLQIGKIKL